MIISVRLSAFILKFFSLFVLGLVMSDMVFDEEFNALVKWRPMRKTNFETLLLRISKHGIQGTLVVPGL